MIGLMMLGIFFALVAFFYWVGGVLTWWLKPGFWKMLIRIALVFAAFPLLVADEIVGKRQFEALCKANGIESAPLAVTKGKSVIRNFGDRHLLSGFSIPIRESENIVKDRFTGEILFTYKDYFTHGGWLMRHTFLSLGNGNPLLFDGNGCKMKENILSKYGFSQTN